MRGTRGGHSAPVAAGYDEAWAPALHQRVRLHSMGPQWNGSDAVVVELPPDGETGELSSDGRTVVVQVLPSCARVNVTTANLDPAFVDMCLLARCRSAAERGERQAAAAREIMAWQQCNLLAPTATRATTDTDLLHEDHRVFLIDHVFSAHECSTILRAVHAAAERRGWNRLRHGSFPTTDLPWKELGDECESWVRAAIFRKVLRPLVPLYIEHLPPAATLPEHLEFHDLFVVKYSAAPGAQRDLSLHRDGSTFSFNILLSEPSAFEGGGTFFEPTGLVARPSQGGAVCHSGQVRHSGVPISRGERYLLVGFVGCAEKPYTLHDITRAEHSSFVKFGNGCWDRSPVVDEPILLWAADR